MSDLVNPSTSIKDLPIKKVLRSVDYLYHRMKHANCRLFRLVLGLPRTEITLDFKEPFFLESTGRARQSLITGGEFVQ